MAELTGNQRNQIAAAVVDSIESLFDFWDSNRKQGTGLEVGQIVYAPVPDTVLRLKIAEVVRSNPRAHDSAELRFRPVDDNSDFRQKTQRLPLAALKLADTEEILVGKGKQRPCVVLASSRGVAPIDLPEGEQRNKGQNAFKSVYCIAPLFSCSSGSKTTAFGPVMAARIKCMMYPEFLFAPKKEPAIDNDSIVRLDRMFWSHLQCATRAVPQYLSAEALSVAWNQIKVMAGEKPDEDYLELRTLLLGELPKECR